MCAVQQRASGVGRVVHQPRSWELSGLRYTPTEGCLSPESEWVGRCPDVERLIQLSPSRERR